MTGMRGAAAVAAAVASVLLLFCRPAVPASSRDITSRQSDTLEIFPNTLREASEGVPLTAGALPPSPKASSFMKYGDYPVSLYTGLVDITVPLYIIRTGWIDIPIELKYHASGLRYDDISMEAGLGWDLIAGGVVTHIVRGAEDTENAQGFFRDVSTIRVISNPETGTGVAGEDYDEVRYTENGARPESARNSSLPYMDGEHDLWHFSFLGHSGTYFFPGSQSSAPCVFIPDNGMKASFGNAPTITDTDGISYSFSATEGGKLDTRQYQEWYLTGIVSADRSDEVTFTYDMIRPDTGYEIRRPFISTTFTRATKFMYGTYQDEDIYSGMAGYDYTYPPRLSRIDFKGGHVEFVYSQSSGNDTWDLESVKVYSGLSDTPLRTVTLHKGLFANGEDRLDRVEFSDVSGDGFSYSFGYNGEPCDFGPQGTQRGVDHWGYFNGTSVTNSRFMPVSDTYDNDGIDRSANEAYMKRGVLDKVVYPTGGYTEFEHEAHKWTESGVQKIYGGLRVKEIRNYLEDGTLAERRWYKYGQAEDGRGSVMTDPALSDYTYTTKNFITVYNESTQPTYNHIEYTTISSMPKRSLFLSGSAVVYPYVTEYEGDEDSDYGKTVYRYTNELNELLPSQGSTYRLYSDDRLLRDNTWKSGMLLSRHVYRKTGGGYTEVRSTENTYRDINGAEYTNLRVRQYATFSYEPEDKTSSLPDYESVYTQYPQYRTAFNAPSNQNPSPYDYYNYYTSTGLRLVASSEETTDGVSTSTRYEYNRYGFPTRSVSVHSTGDSTVTVTRYVTDEGSLYSGMTSRNIVSPVTSVDVTRNGVPVSSTATRYSNNLSSNAYLYALSEAESSLSSDIEVDPWKVTYHKYDTYGHPLYLTQSDGLDVVYIWSYGSMYPVLEIRNATYTQVSTALGSSLMSSIPGMENPTDAQLEGYAATLRESLDDAMVTLYTYRPLVGVSSVTDPSGRKTTYEYDGFGRLIKVTDEDGNPLESYEYNYVHQ